MEHEFVQQKFPLLYEIYTLSTLSDQQDHKNCLYGINGLKPESNGNWLYEYYENLLQRIDQDNWEVFKKKLSKNLIGIHQNARISIIGKNGKTNHSPIYPKFQGFDYFNEVNGYLYLKDRMRCEEVTFLQENQNKTPDLKGTKGTSTIVLEVKTINPSDDFSAYLERGVRDDQKTTDQKSIDLNYRRTKKEIPGGLENKIESDVEHAKDQMADSPDAQKIVLFVIDLDNPNVRVYLWQKLKEIEEKNEEIQIVAGLQSLWRPQNKGFEWFYDK